jgi:hypothetical protein
MRLKFSTLLLWTISIGSIILALKASNEPMLKVFRDTWIDSFFQQFSTGNLIVFDLSIGFLISVFFYLLVACYPNRKRKNLIKRNFEEQYLSFKHDMICIFLGASEKFYDSELPSKLSDQSEFKKFFTTPDKNDSRNIRWYAVLNGLNEYHLKELLVAMEIFMNEVSYVLNNVEINDPNVFSFFKRLSQAVHKMKNSTLEYEDVKQLSGFLWDLFAGWNFIDGYREDDIVKVMIEKI